MRLCTEVTYTKMTITTTTTTTTMITRRTTMMATMIAVEFVGAGAVKGVRGGVCALVSVSLWVCLVRGRVGCRWLSVCWKSTSYRSVQRDLGTPALKMLTRLFMLLI